MNLALKGRYTIQHVRDGLVLATVRGPNGIVNVGLEDLLNVHFRNGTQKTQWWIGLINSSGFTALADADTMASHAGWTEFTSYTGNRKEWDPDVPAGRAISNGVAREFNINASGGVRGIFVNSDETGTAGILWAAALFASSITVEDQDVLKVTYTVSG